MTPFEAALSSDARYLQSIARLFLWEVAWEPDGSVRISHGDQTVRAFFTDEGAFRFGRASGPRTTDHDLRLPETIRALERDHAPSMPSAALDAAKPFP